MPIAKCFFFSATFGQSRISRDFHISGLSEKISGDFRTRGNARWTCGLSDGGFQVAQDPVTPLWSGCT